jgi:hypothetical protein
MSNKIAATDSKKSNKMDWSALLVDALTNPGRVNKAYRAFHGYSLGNGYLAAVQLAEKNLDLSPISSYNGWKKLGRVVKKGEKAIALVMPVTVKASKSDQTEGSPSSENDKSGGSRTIFLLKNNWFSLDQTEGDIYVNEVKVPDWDKDQALTQLGIYETAFSHFNGNMQGYAIPNEKTIAVSPVAAMPWKTRFHEMAHCILHSAEGQMSDVEVMTKDIKEAEAESVAYLCCATLELPGLEESRDYIQSWLASSNNSDDFSKRSALRVFSTADKILKAGNKTLTDESVPIDD